MMEVTAAHGLLGFQTASVNINDTSAKYHAALEDGLGDAAWANARLQEHGRRA